MEFLEPYLLFPLITNGVTPLIFFFLGHVPCEHHGDVRADGPRKSLSDGGLQYGLWPILPTEIDRLAFRRRVDQEAMRQHVRQLPVG